LTISIVTTLTTSSVSESLASPATRHWAVTWPPQQPTV